MKVSDLKARLAHAKDDDEVVLSVKTVTANVGGHPYAVVTKASSGFDWDKGKFFLAPDAEVYVADERFARDKAFARDASEALGFLYRSLSSKDLDAEGKVRAAKNTLARFGFAGVKDLMTD